MGDMRGSSQGGPYFLNNTVVNESNFAPTHNKWNHPDHSYNRKVMARALKRLERSPRRDYNASYPSAQPARKGGLPQLP